LCQDDSFHSFVTIPGELALSRLLPAKAFSFNYFPLFYHGKLCRLHAPVFDDLQRSTQTAQSISHARVPWRSTTHLRRVIRDDDAVEIIPFQNPQESRNVHVAFVNERFLMEWRLQEFYFWRINP